MSKKWIVIWLVVLFLVSGIIGYLFFSLRNQKEAQKIAETTSNIETIKQQVVQNEFDWTKDRITGTILKKTGDEDGNLAFMLYISWPPNAPIYGLYFTDSMFPRIVKPNFRRGTVARGINVYEQAEVNDAAAQFTQVDEKDIVFTPKNTVQKALRMLAVFGLGVALTSCSSSSIEASPTVFVESSPTAQPTATETATPTEIPDPMLQAAESLGADWGSLEKVGDQWIYDSPEDVIVGKDVEVTLGTLNIDGVDRSAILVDGEWPIALENEAGDWEQTPIQYVDVKKPLVNSDGTPLYLGCDPDTAGQFKIFNCFLVKSGETFVENEVEYTQAAVSLNEQGLAFTMFIFQGQAATATPSLMVYPSRIYTEGQSGLRGIGNGFKYSQLEVGEVFFLRPAYDRENLEKNIERLRSEGNQVAVFINEKILEFRDAAINIFSNINANKFHEDMLNHFEFSGSSIVGIGK
ncbi:MAG: hypothetical protein WD740_05400 [Anaerolineales bacterium]